MVGIPGTVTRDSGGIMSPPEYTDFIQRKTQLDGEFGFDPTFIPDYLFPFQRALVEWAVRKGRGALFADCGLGKTLMEMVWAQNVYERTGKPVIILTPLAVAQQFAREAAKFGLDVSRSSRGEIESPVIVTNYERLHLFNPDVFSGVVCDESSILKSFDGVRKNEITEFMRTMEFRLLGTATAAPNDYTELGTSSEALGYLGHMDMLSRFFTNKQQTSRQIRGKFGGHRDEWRFKGHAETAFWKWVSSWARAIRRPSDFGFSDDGFRLPDPIVRDNVVATRTARPGMLFDLPAKGFFEEREERKRTVQERCEMAASLVTDTGKSAVVWCHLNPEGDLLESLIPDAQQVSGRDSDESKEEKFEAFTNGQIRVLITKPKIGAWGLNWQHCSHLTYFPDYSYEQYYQAVRRCWRFGQVNPVTVDIVATPGEVEMQDALKAKEDAASKMFTELVSHMQDAIAIDRTNAYTKRVEVPAWL